MKSHLNEYWRWENYRDFFNITVFRYLVLWFTLVPILASLLGGLETPLLIPIGGKIYSIGLGISFSWQILWMSSLFFFLALFLYTLRCPKFIKKYHNFTEYKAVGHDLRWIVYEIRSLKLSGEDLSEFTKKLTTKNFAVVTNDLATEKPLVEENQTVYRYKSGKKDQGETIQVGAPVLGTDSHIVEDAERGLFWEIFAAFSGSRVCERLIILVMLCLSALCFAFVLIEHIYHGWLYVQHWILRQ